MVREEEKNELGHGYISRACQNLGLKSTKAYYNGLENKKIGKALSPDQKAVMKELERITSE